MIFPVWFLEVLVIGGLVLCGIGAAVLVVFLWSDSKGDRIW